MSDNSSNKKNDQNLVFSFSESPSKKESTSIINPESSSPFSYIEKESPTFSNNSEDEKNLNLNGIEITILSLLGIFKTLEKDYLVEISFSNEKGVIIKGKNAVLCIKELKKIIEDNIFKEISIGKEFNKVKENIEKLEPIFKDSKFIICRNFKKECDNLDNNDYNQGFLEYTKLKEKNENFVIFYGKKTDVENLEKEIKNLEILFFESKINCDIEFLNEVFKEEIKDEKIQINYKVEENKENNDFCNEFIIKYDILIQSQLEKKLKFLENNIFNFPLSFESYSYLNYLQMKINQELKSKKIKLFLTKYDTDPDFSNFEKSKTNSKNSKFYILALKSKNLNIFKEFTKLLSVFCEEIIEGTSDFIFPYEIIIEFKEEIEKICLNNNIFLRKIHENDKNFGLDLYLANDNFPLTKIKSQKNKLNLEIQLFLDSINQKEVNISFEILKKYQKNQQNLNLVFIKKNEKKTLILSKDKTFNLDNYIENMINLLPISQYLSPMWKNQIFKLKLENYLNNYDKIYNFSFDFNERKLNINIIKDPKNFGKTFDNSPKLEELSKFFNEYNSKSYKIQLDLSQKFIKSLSDSFLSELEFKYSLEITKNISKSFILQRFNLPNSPRNEKFLTITKSNLLKESLKTLIIVPTDENISNTGGFSLYLTKVYGSDFEIECKKLRSSKQLKEIGESILLTYQNKSFLFAKSPVYSGLDREMVDLYEKFVTRTLEKASSMNYNKVALPLISSGNNEFGIDMASYWLIRFIINYLNSMISYVEEVIIIEKDAEKYQKLQKNTLKLVEKTENPSLDQSNDEILFGEFRWYWDFTDENRMEAYDLNTSGLIEKSFQNKDEFCDISDRIPANYIVPTHSFDFNTMKVTHLRYLNSCKFERKNGTYYIFINDKEKIKLSKAKSEILENFYKKNDKKKIIQILATDYVIDLKNMVQINIFTLFKRKIERKKEKVYEKDIYPAVNQLSLEILEIKENNQLKDSSFLCLNGFDSSDLQNCVIEIKKESEKLKINQIFKGDFKDKINDIKNICNILELNINNLTDNELDVTGFKKLIEKITLIMKKQGEKKVLNKNDEKYKKIKKKIKQTTKTKIKIKEIQEFIDQNIENFNSNEFSNDVYMFTEDENFLKTGKISEATYFALNVSTFEKKKNQNIGLQTVGLCKISLGIHKQLKQKKILNYKEIQSSKGLMFTITDRKQIYLEYIITFSY